MISYSQDIKDGVYTYGYKNHYIMCIKNDTIFQLESKNGYLGTYKFKDNKYYWGQNLLFDRNAIIDREICSPDSIEIRIIDKYKIHVFGGPDTDSTIYEGESDFYSIWINNKQFTSRNMEGIKISKGQLSEEELSKGFFMYEEGWHMSVFEGFFSFPLEYGTRYILKQIYYDFRPTRVFESSKYYFTIKIEKGSKDIWYRESNSMYKEYVKLNYVSPNVDSCFNEFKNRFPLLFE